ncbi:MAG: glycosyltransferase family 4 protein [Candidatus Eisenbacteria bacterium]
MRVLFLSHNRSDSDDAYNHRLRALRDALEEEGMDARMAYLGDDPLGKPTLLHAFKIGRTPGIDEADVLHGGSAAVAFACAFLRRAPGRRLIFDMHGDTVAEAALHARGLAPAARLRTLQERWKERIGLRRADRVLVVSEPLREHVLALGVPGERIVLVRNGVDLDRFPAAPPPPARPEPLVIYAGRFEAWQGVESLLGVAARAASGRFRLRVIGFGDEDRALKDRFRGIGGEGVDLIDRVPQERLSSMLAEADLLLLPREPGPAAEVALPTKFGEYLALGRPVILTRVGEPALLVEEGRCGIVTEPGAESIASGIARFASLGAGERRAMEGRARALAERLFDWRSIGREYAAYLRTL